MGYFSNGTEGDLYRERFCLQCRHWIDKLDDRGPGCPIWDLHLLWGYDACNADKSNEQDPLAVKRLVLDEFIPVKGINNEECVMFLRKRKQKGTSELPPFQAHSETSREAAIRAIELKETLGSDVLSFFVLRRTRGATDEELIDNFSGRASANAVRPRRVELTDAGILFDSGTTRPNRSGRRAVVWRFFKAERLDQLDAEA